MNHKTRYPYVWILGAMAFTLCVRCLVLYLCSGPLGFVAGYPDETNYYLPASQMVGESLSGFFLSPRSLWNGPLNPLWLALLGGNVAVAKFANVALFSLASGVLAGAVGCQCGWRKGAAVVLGLLVYPPTYDLVPTVLTEPLYVSLLMFSFATLILGEFLPTSCVVSGLLFGLATLVRPTSQMFAPMLVALGVVYWRTAWGKRLALHGVCAFAICLPTMTWNYVHFGKASVANGLGAVLYLGNDLRRDGDEPIYSGADFDTFRITTPYTHLDTDGDARLVAVARERMIQRPLSTAALVVRKSFRYLFGSFNGYFWPFDGLVAKIRHESSPRSKGFSLLWPALHVLVVCGALASLIRRDISLLLRIYVGALTFYFIALHAVTFPIPRMVFPLFPYLLVMAIVGLCTRESGRGRLMLVGIGGSLIFAFIGAPRHSQFDSEIERDHLELFEQRASGMFEGAHEIQDGRITGNDPYQTYRFERVPLLRSQMVSFSISIHCPETGVRQGLGQLFWRIEDGSFEEAQSSIFAMRSVSSLHLVKPALSPSWKGNLTGLRVDFPAEFKQCVVSLSEVQLLD